jgi:non-specific serine/threonine protein kinase
LPRRYLTQLCHTPDLERSKELAPLSPPAESELSDWANTAPPMRGGEYLNADRLAGFWMELDQHIRAQIDPHPEGAGAWLKGCHPLWRMVGRVTFHLAENKRHPTHPFAFMASYASRISSQSRVQHLPLGRALQEYAGAGNKPALLNLLAPVQKAAEQGAFVRELVENHRIFKPLPWTPAEAYRFLKEESVCEAAGVIVRLPDWWKGSRPPRPRVSVRIGQQRGAGLGADTLLDFSVETTLDGQPLTEAEWQSLLQAANGLELVRGQWIEVDSEKLRDALAHWRKVESLSRRGELTFFEGMQLISGFQPGAVTDETAVALAAEREWTGVQPGEWLEEVLTELRDPSRAPTQLSLPGLRAELRPYQAMGVHWLEFLARLGLGGCLADDMGLGKTLQVLALLLKRKTATRQNADPHCESDAVPNLLIVPTSLLANWRAEIERFTPGLSFLILHPSEAQNPAIVLESGADRKVDLVITTYGMVSRLKALSERLWQITVLEEAQAIKNPDTPRPEWSRNSRPPHALPSPARPSRIAPVICGPSSTFSIPVCSVPPMHSPSSFAPARARNVRTTARSAPSPVPTSCAG